MNRLRMLLPGETVVGDLGTRRAEAMQSLADLYAFPDPVPASGWVRASMVSTVDGAAFGADGRSGSVSSPADRALFSVLRGLADVILVGAGTARAERYRLPEPKPEFADRRADAGQRPAPVLAVVSRTATPSDLPWLCDDPSGALILLPETADTLRWRDSLGADRVLVCGRQEVDPRCAIAGLAARGLPRIQVEGGPSWLGQIVATDLLDELCLTLTPMIAGGPGPRVVTGPAADLRTRPVHLVECDGTLLGRWRVRRD
jgi:riboflavin biosynthesis pyrimidine reductase